MTTYVADRGPGLSRSNIIFQYRGKDGRLQPHPYRPGIAIKHMDRKRALQGFTGGIDPGKLDHRPENVEVPKPEKGYVFRGHMLDAKGPVIVYTRLRAVDASALRAM